MRFFQLSTCFNLWLQLPLYKFRYNWLKWLPPANSTPPWTPSVWTFAKRWLAKGWSSSSLSPSAPPSPSPWTPGPRRAGMHHRQEEEQPFYTEEKCEAQGGISQEEISIWSCQSRYSKKEQEAAGWWFQLWPMWIYIQIRKWSENSQRKNTQRTPFPWESARATPSTSSECVTSKEPGEGRGLPQLWHGHVSGTPVPRRPWVWWQWC